MGGVQSENQTIIDRNVGKKAESQNKQNPTESIVENNVSPAVFGVLLHGTGTSQDLAAAKTEIGKLLQNSDDTILAWMSSNDRYFLHNSVWTRMYAAVDNEADKERLKKLNQKFFSPVK
jgi:hypothetical protein